MKENNKKVYLCYPQNFLTYEQINDYRERMCNRLKDGEMLVDTGYMDSPELDRMSFMVEGISELSRCSRVIASPDWTESRKCRAEVLVATIYGIPVEIMEAWE